MRGPGLWIFTLSSSFSSSGKFGREPGEWSVTWGAGGADKWRRGLVDLRCVLRGQPKRIAVSSQTLARTTNAISAEEPEIRDQNVKPASQNEMAQVCAVEMGRLKAVAASHHGTELRKFKVTSLDGAGAGAMAFAAGHFQICQLGARGFFPMT
jgi:hypothetical protein